MNKIYIFENTNALHVEESLETIYKIFSLKYDVVFCLGDKAVSRVSDNIGIMKHCIALDSYWKIMRFFRAIDGNDIVIYPTISVRNSLILFILSFVVTKNIYYIRNSNSWLEYSCHKTDVFSRVLSNATTFIKKKLLNRAHQIFVANSNLKDYLESRGVVKKINIVPYKLFDKTNTHSVLDYDRFKFVIPGGIDISKKDLKLIRTATNILSKGDRERFTIILLGRPADKLNQDFCVQWKREIGDSLMYYTSFIPDQEFTAVLRESHFVLGVLNVNFQDKYNSEIYGVSKDTGVDAQAIAYGKPLIINGEFRVAKEIESSSIGFGNAVELAKIIKTLIYSDNYQDLSEESLENSHKLSLESIVNQLKGI
jgi:hypothetical protein